MKAKDIAIYAMIAALYFITTIIFSPISFGPVQFRVAEMLVMLCLFKKGAIAGVTIGCMIANLYSPMGIIDVIFGGLATLLICIFVNKTQKPFASVIFGSILSGIVVSAEMSIMIGVDFFQGFLGVFVGELVSLGAGSILFFEIYKRGVVVWQDRTSK